MTDKDTNASTTDQPWYRRLPWRRITSVLAVVVLLVVVIPFVVYAVPQVAGGDHSYVVLSGSMQPTMSPGDVIIVANAPATAISEGDVITFRRPGESRPTTHRVTDVQNQDGETAFRTAGDNNEDPDPELVGADRVIGKVVSIGGSLLVVPFIGRIIMFSGTQTGFILLAVVPISLFILNEIWGVITSTRDSQIRQVEEEEASVSADVSDETSSEGTVTFSASELRFGIAILVIFLAYSSWVAYATLESWAIGAFGAVGTSTLLAVGLYVFGGSASPSVSASSELPQSEDTGHAVEQPLQDSSGDDAADREANSGTDRLQPDQTPDRAQGSPVGGDQDD